MQNNSSEDAYHKLDVIAAYQIIGGTIGLVLTGFSIYKSTDISWVLFLIAIGFYTFSIYCGVTLFMNKGTAIRYSLINQFLQLFSFSLLGYAFEYVSGLSLFIGIDFANSLNFKSSISISTWHILVNDDSGISEINFNLVALFIIIFIVQLKKKTSKQDTENQLAQFGE